MGYPYPKFAYVLFGGPMDVSECYVQGAVQAGKALLRKVKGTEHPANNLLGLQAIHIHTHTYTSTYMHTHIPTHTCRNTYIYIHIHSQTHTYTFIHVRLHMHLCTYYISLCVGIM